MCSPLVSRGYERKGNKRKDEGKFVGNNNGKKRGRKELGGKAEDE